MRCPECNAQIPWWRRLRAREYCSEECYNKACDVRSLRRVVEGEVEINGILGRIKLPFRMARSEFGTLLLLLVVVGAVSALIKLGFPARFLTGDGTHRVTFDLWEGRDLQDWMAVDGQTPWRLEQRWMQPLGEVFYRALSAVKGTLEYTISLADRGSAIFLIGYDTQRGSGIEVQLDSGDTDLIVTAAQITAGEPSQLQGSLTVPRRGRNRHEIRIEFGDTLTARVDGSTTTWPDARIEPGLIGVAGSEEDDFRVFSAAIELRS